MHEILYTHIDINCYSIIDLNYISSSNLHLHSYERYFVNVFGSFMPAIILIALRFKSSIWFGIHTLLDTSIRVLQLSKDLSMNSNEIHECIHWDVS